MSLFWPCGLSRSGSFHLWRFLEQPSLPLSHNFIIHRCSTKAKKTSEVTSDLQLFPKTTVTFSRSSSTVQPSTKLKTLQHYQNNIFFNSKPWKCFEYWMFILRTSFLIEKCNIRNIGLIIIIYSTEISLIFHVPKFQNFENCSTPKRTIPQGRRNRPVKSISEFEFWSVSNHLQKFFSV